MDYRDNRQRWAESHQVVHFYAGQWCTFTPALTLTLRSDFSVLSTAIEQMIQNNLVGEVDTLSDHPFRRRSLLEALYRELGLPKLTWCC